MPDYSFQDRAITDILAARERGVKRLVATAPTGSGKSVCISRLFGWALSQGIPAIVYSNRLVVMEMLQKRLTEHGLKHGVRAAGILPHHDLPLQVSSIGTERARSLNPDHPWEVFNAGLVIVDEAHSQKATTARKLLDAHGDAFVVGFTATPVGIGFEYEQEGGTNRRLYDELLVLATQLEMRQAGVLVTADVFAPSEIDCEGISVNADGEFSQVQCQDRFKQVQRVVYASVVEWMRKLNPELKGIVLFPPGVPESRWFCAHLAAEGISARHIDANTSTKERHEVFEMHEEGSLAVISSYGVIQEGFDAPWARHCVLCRPVNAVTTYLQIIGRVLRAHPDKDKAIIQDHVGAFWRPGLGSPNATREWDLNDTNKTISARVKKQRQFPDDFDKDGTNQEPARCTKCGQVLKPSTSGYNCPCGHQFKRSQRMVIQLDGTLKRQQGRAIPKKSKRDDAYFFRNAIFAAVNKNMSCSATYALACKLKADHLQVETASIDSREVRKARISVPDSTSLQWHDSARRVWPWAWKQAQARRKKAPAEKPF